MAEKVSRFDMDWWVVQKRLIYIAASDLIPEVNREGGPALAWTVFAGLLFFVLADWLLSAFVAH